jgi:hypothetical protein
MIPILITFLFGAVDFMNAFRQWSTAAKAVELGARIAAVSDPVASGLNNLPLEAANNTTVTTGASMPYFQITCDGGAGSCTCIDTPSGGTSSGACGLNYGSYSATAMGLIVYGRDGKGKCGDATSEYFLGMCDIFAPIQPKYVRVVYTQTGLGNAGNCTQIASATTCQGTGPVPTITVSINAGASKLPFKFFFLPFRAVSIPSMTTTITGEALLSAAAN